MNAVGRIWMIGGAILAVLIVALGWFVLAMPQLTAAAQAGAQQADVDAQNALLEAQLVEMQGQYENLDDLKEELEALQLTVPGTQDLDDFVDQLATDANAAGVVLDSVKIGKSIPWDELPTSWKGSAGGGEEGDAGDVSPNQGEIVAPVLPAATLTPNLYGLEVTLDVGGDASQTTAFFNLLQSNEGRLILLYNVQIRYATSLTGTILAYIFVAHDPTTGPVGALPTPTPTPEATDPAAEETPGPTDEPAPSASATPAP